MISGSGKCLCGAVSYRFEAKSNEFTGCHCKMCQRWSGGAFLALPAADVQFDGKDDLVLYTSSDIAKRGFCRQCGSSLFYLATPTGNFHLCVGTIDEPDELSLAEEIFIDRKPAGYSFTGDRPRLTEEETIAKYLDYQE